MRILTTENIPFNVDFIADTPVSELEGYRYCIFDGGDEDYADYFFLPLVFLESFHAPAVCLRIGKFEIQMPMDWSVVTTDEHLGSIEIIPLTSLNSRGFMTPVYNPLKSWMPSVEEVQITNIYQDVKWFFPKLKFGHVLVVPLEDCEEPKCALFVKDGNKVKNIDFADLL